MRTPQSLGIFAVGLFALGVAAASTGAHAQATSPTDRSDFNTSEPGVTNQTKPTGRPASVGRPPHVARHRPGDSATVGSRAPGTQPTQDRALLNTAGPEGTNESQVARPAVVGRPPAQAARNPGDSVKQGNIASTPSLDAASRNTGGPENTNSTSRAIH